LDLCRWFFPPSMERIHPWHTSNQETVGIASSHLMGHKDTRMINNSAHLNQNQGFF